LIERGLLTPDAELTGEGTQVRQWVEERTDEGGAVPWQAIGTEATARTAELLTPISLHIAQNNAAMEVNPMALSPVAELSRPMAERAG
jgi:helix-turn-helix protein